jgi:hypothetical protein
MGCLLLAAGSEPTEEHKKRRKEEKTFAHGTHGIARKEEKS